MLFNPSFLWFGRIGFKKTTLVDVRRVILLRRIVQLSNLWLPENAGRNSKPKSILTLVKCTLFACLIRLYVIPIFLGGAWDMGDDNSIVEFLISAQLFQLPFCTSVLRFWFFCYFLDWIDNINEYKNILTELIPWHSLTKTNLVKRLRHQSFCFSVNLVPTWHYLHCRW